MRNVFTTIKTSAVRKLTAVRVAFRRSVRRYLVDKILYMEFDIIENRACALDERISDEVLKSMDVISDNADECREAIMQIIEEIHSLQEQAKELASHIEEGDEELTDRIDEIGRAMVTEEGVQTMMEDLDLSECSNWKDHESRLDDLEEDTHSHDDDDEDDSEIRDELISFFREAASELECGGNRTRRMGKRAGY